MSYTPRGYPSGTNSATGLPWAAATDGLRNLTGHVKPNGTVSLYASTSTVSGSGDQGADPNSLVLITDNVAAISLPSTVDKPGDALLEVRCLPAIPVDWVVSGPHLLFVLLDGRTDRPSAVEFAHDLCTSILPLLGRISQQAMIGRSRSASWWRWLRPGLPPTTGETCTGSCPSWSSRSSRCRFVVPAGTMNEPAETIPRFHHGRRFIFDRSDRRTRRRCQHRTATTTRASAPATYPA
jgi:hypothetical protein